MLLPRYIAVIFLVLWSGTAGAVDWPQEITAPEGTIVVYEPQPETMDGNTIKGRAAVSLELKDHKDPIFGAMWFTAHIETDKDNRTATVHDVTVTKVGWPGSKDAGEQRFTTIVEQSAAKAAFEISLDRLSAGLASSRAEQKSLEQLKTDPPKIVFRDHLALLLLYDGEPRFSPVEKSEYERALNVPMVVVRDTKTKTCYLSSGALWYEAKDPMGPWSRTTSPPADLVALLPKPADASPPANVPSEIVVATAPTELICTDGPADWQTLPGGKILYVKNTETPWLRELSTNNMYVLLSGRWYRSQSQDGPWTFVRSGELPASFKNIPPDSDIGGVRTSVAGTDEAEDAMLDADIPQTATIKRSEATVTVDYDGDPKFENIAGTNVSYAVNTGSQVLEINGKYYVVDNGVWFVGPGPTGPWQVADSIPENEIDKIPPSSPVYNTTYVTIFESTPDYVTFGYYPGYLWSFPFYGVPVYGTGWYYAPYWGAHYYPRPLTWGFHVGYNPWTGWNFGVSWSNGFFSLGVGWGGGYGHYHPWGCCGGWYGGGYHRGPTIINTGNINIGNNINVGNRANVANRLHADQGGRTGTRNLYNRPETRSRNADPAVARQNLQKARPAPSRPNNIFADKSGNVARHSSGGWETRDQGGWQRQTGRQPELESELRSRDLGAARERRMGGFGGGGRRRR